MSVEGAGEPAAGALEDLGDGLGDVDGRALAADRAEHEVIAAGGTGLGGLVHGDGRGDGRMHGDLARNVAAAGMRGVGARGLGRRVGVGGTHHGVGRIAHLVEMRPLVLHVQTGQLHRVFRRKHVGSAGRHAGRRAGRGRGGRSGRGGRRGLFPLGDLQKHDRDLLHRLVAVLVLHRGSALRLHRHVLRSCLGWRSSSSSRGSSSSSSSTGNRRGGLGRSALRNGL